MARRSLARSWHVLERFRGQLVQMEIEDVLRWGIHTALTWIVETSAEPCDAIHEDYLDPPEAALRHSVRVARNPSFRPLAS